MSFKEEIYKKYITFQVQNIAKDHNLDNFKKNFIIFEKYYGTVLPKDFSSKIIDIACGSGEIVYWLTEKGYKNAEGIDISEEQVKLANSLGIKNVGQADLRDYLKNKSNYYDTIFAIDIIEHFKKDELVDVLKLIYDSLKENGVLIIKTPNGESIFGTRYLYSDITHEIIFTERSLKEFLSFIGFKDLIFKESGPVVHGIKSFVRFSLWKIIRLFLKLYLLIETGENSNILTQNIICVAKK
jgi:2-polyprenyl-3-methyl-5-hydroxy-6-metoxy-1,4-benzoquinol methylase